MTTRSAVKMKSPQPTVPDYERGTDTMHRRADTENRKSMRDVVKLMLDWNV
jgi:hypothetical protein